MKNQKINSVFRAIALSITLACLASVPSFAQDAVENQAINNTELETTTNEDVEQQIEQEKGEAETKAQDSLVSEAVDAISETQTAIAAIDAGNKQEAIDALANATGKLDIVLARSPELALVPVETSVTAIDTAPNKPETVKEIREDIDDAVDRGDLPTARELLNNLMSEIRTTTVNLPLATYPDAMKEAARLLDADKTDAAKLVLQDALSTLIVTEISLPLPVITAESLVEEAAQLEDKDKDKALQLVGDAKTQLELAEELGYVASENQYAELSQEIESLESQIKADGNTGNAFTKLKDNISAFFKSFS